MTHIIQMLQEFNQIDNIPKFGCAAFDAVELRVYFHPDFTIDRVYGCELRMSPTTPCLRVSGSCQVFLPSVGNAQ